MKKFISLALCGALAAVGVLGIAACGEEAAPSLTVWGPSAQQESLAEMIAQFKEDNGITYEIKLGVCGEGDSFSMMSNDPQSGANVFAFANDQLVNLYSVGVLSPLAPSVVTSLKQTDDEAALESGKLSGNYYGYPYAADNGYFLYYDKSVVSDTQAQTLKGVIDACTAKGKDFIFEGTNSWYALSFAYGAGGTYEVTYDGTTVTSLTVDLDQKNPDGGQYSYGQLGGYELAWVLQQSCTKVGVDTDIDNSLNGGTFGACIRGTWVGDKIKNALGTNFGATVLPKWKSDLDGNEYAWKSFAGYKLFGVNAYTPADLIEDAHKLASFLTSEAMQEKRFDDNGIGPSNKAVAALQKVKDDPAIAAITKQIEEASILQTSMPTNYWSEADSFGQAMKTFDLTAPAATLQERVVQMVEAMKSVAPSA